MSKFHILVAPAHINFNARWGGEATWAYNIIKYISKKFPVKFQIVCGKANIDKCGEVKVYEVCKRLSGNLLDRALFMYKYTRIAKIFLREERFDLVHHLFPFGFRTGLNPLVISNKLGVTPFIIGPIQYPQIWSDIFDYIHISGEGGLKAKLLYYTNRAILKLLSKPIKELHTKTLEAADALIFDSRKTLDLYKKLYYDILKGKVLSIIPAGVDLEKFKYKETVMKGHYEILTVGYLLRRKGIQYLIYALVDIIKEIKNVLLRVIGDGPYKRELEALVKKLGVQDYVRFEGHISRDLLPRFYELCNIYVQPSLSETFPSTVREAMAVGRPIIATNVGTMSEHISDGYNGYLVPPESSEALTRKIVELLSNDEKRHKVGLSARKSVEENFAWDKIAERWYSLYSLVIL